MANRARENIIFQNAITSAANGNTFKVNDTEVVDIEFAISSGGAFTANFEAQTRDGGAWLPVKAYNLSTALAGLSSTATDAGAIYQIDTTGLISLRVRVSAISGTLSVYGRAVW